jgi:hypothetical protein
MYCDTGPLHTACSVPYPTCSVFVSAMPSNSIEPMSIVERAVEFWGLGLELGQGRINRWTSEGTTSRTLALHGRIGEAKIW